MSARRHAQQEDGQMQRAVKSTASKFKKPSPYWSVRAGSHASKVLQETTWDEVYQMATHIASHIQKGSIDAEVARDYLVQYFHFLDNYLSFHVLRVVQLLTGTKLIGNVAKVAREMSPVISKLYDILPFDESLITWGQDPI